MMNTAPQQLSGQPAFDPFLTQQGTRPNFDLNSAFLYSSLFDSLPPVPRRQEVPFKEPVANVKKCPHSELYKTELCRYWRAKLPCKFGSGCWFAHGPEELQIAQFIVPAKNTGFNSLDYEVRNDKFLGFTGPSAYQEVPEMQMRDGGKLRLMDEMKSSSLGNDNFLSTFWPQTSESSVNLAAASNSCFPKTAFSKAVGCEREARKVDHDTKLDEIGLNFKAYEPWTPWASDFGDSGVASSRCSSNISSATCSDKENQSPTFSADPKNVFQSPSSTSSDDSDRQNSALKNKLCDMYKWCGQCFMGSSCPYDHPH